MQLKRVVDALRPEFADRIAFVTADLSTREGQAFASRFGVGETTLLFLDGNGMPVNQYHGTTTESQLRRVIEGTFGYGAPRPELSRQSPDFNALRETIDRYNENAKSIIDSMGR